MTKKVKAPIGYHFMVRESDNDFYLMRTSGRYVKHTSGDYSSALSVEIEVKGTHSAPTTTQRTATATSSTGSTTTTRTVTNTRSTTVRGY